MYFKFSTHTRNLMKVFKNKVPFFLPPLSDSAIEIITTSLKNSILLFFKPLSLFKFHTEQQTIEALSEHFSNFEPTQKQPLNYVETNENHHKEALIEIRKDLDLLLEEIRKNDQALIDISKMFATYNKTKEIQPQTNTETIRILAREIAHEFNNILIGIQPNIELARKQLKYFKGANLPFMSERLSAAENSCYRARKLSSQLLTFAHGETIEQSEFPISPLIKEAVDFHFRHFKGKYNLDLAADLHLALGEKAVIHKVVDRLFRKAAESILKDGKIKIEAENTTEMPSLYPSTKFGTYLLLKINIEAQEAGLRFKRLLLSNEIGDLAISYDEMMSIVNHNEGKISFNFSNIGMGCSLILPSSSKEEFKTGATKERSEKLSEKGKLLILDDDEHIHETLSKMLNSLGYDADFVTDGEKVLTLYGEAMKSTSLYKAVILDLTIPRGLGGKEIINRLYNIDPFVIALISSGYTDDPIMTKPEKFGFRGIIPKPYNLSELTIALNRVLDNKSRHD